MMKMEKPTGRRMRQIVEEIFPVVRDIDDHIDDFEEVNVV